ncbi:MAG: enoyl-CoA hydratase family protein [Dehalococcoidia bacterium]|nr:enoyl-CoA hydratase family protein [Dehalococcoidia bacterium]
MTYKSFDYQIQDNVGIITFTRPDTLNSLTLEIYAELGKATREIALDDDVKAVVITGQGNRGFCSGGDVNEIIGALQGKGPKEMLDFTRMTGALTKGIYSIRKPTIAAVNGIASGAGAVIACACDIRIATPRARFSFLFNRVGLTGADMGAVYLLQRIVGMGHAAELLYTGDIVSSERAERIGLVNRIVPEDELMPSALDLARKIAKGPPVGVRMTKEALEVQRNMNIDGALEWDAYAQALCMSGEDHAEGYRAFLEKREPVFRGR